MWFTPPKKIAWFWVLSHRLIGLLGLLKLSSHLRTKVGVVVYDPKKVKHKVLERIRYSCEAFAFYRGASHRAVLDESVDDVGFADLGL